MPRAELHYAMAIDREIFQASRVDPTLLDPVIVVEGGLPGVARPIAVVRYYQGPQGMYTEDFVLADPKGRELAPSPVRRIELTGQMAEDRLVSQLHDIQIDSPDEHELVFFLNGEEAGRVPVFVESADGGDPHMAAEEAFTKAVKKGDILWLTVPQPDGRRHEQPVWFTADNGRVYVVTGPGEQEVPNLAAADEVGLTVRSKDIRSRISEVPADVRVIAPDDPRYEDISDNALKKRLNLADPANALERWKANCQLVELVPRFRPQAEQVAPAAAAPAAAAGPTQGEATTSAAGQAASQSSREDVQVEAQIDQEVYDQLIAEGKSERIARSKAKAAYVRAEKKRLAAEQAGDGDS